VQWITDANIDAARQRRIATAVEWMAEGLPQNWRYQKKEDSGREMYHRQRRID
jgi:hypothetical protein